MYRSWALQVQYCLSESVLGGVQSAAQEGWVRRFIRLYYQLSVFACFAALPCMLVPLFVRREVSQTSSCL